MISTRAFNMEGRYEEDEYAKFGTIAQLMSNLRYFSVFYKSYDKKVFLKIFLPLCSWDGVVTFRQPMPIPIIRLNMAGKSYHLNPDKIMQRSGHSFMHRFAMAAHKQRIVLADAYIPHTDEYFFERSSRSFDPIYRYFVSGILHRPQRYCPHEFLHDLKYWQIAITAMQPCCRAEMQRLHETYALACASTQPVEYESCDSLSLQCAKRHLWQLVDVPESSLAARLFAFVSIAAVVLSNSALIIGSLHMCQVDHNYTNPNTNESVTEREPHPIFESIELGCVAWFTVEYLLKLVSAADTCHVFMQKMNLIDLMAIVPFYLELVMTASGISVDKLRRMKGVFLVIRILRLLRVMRIFKLGRYSAGLQLFGLTLMASASQLGMLSMVILTALVFFSSILYFIENDVEGSKFTSIPAGFWWCIVTMTTVGYGDIVPITFGGKVIACGAIACGVLVLAVPITIIVDNFMRVTHEHKERTGENSGVALALKMHTLMYE